MTTTLAPCTARTVRCTDARDYHRELRECCRQHVRDIMRDLTALMTDAGVTWWADYGTLLGAVRNPMTTWADYPWLPQEGRATVGPLAGIIPHDKDGDLGALWQHWMEFRALRRPLEKLGYTVQLNPTRGAAKVFRSVRNHTNVDVFFWRKKKDGSAMFRMGYANVDQFKGKEFSPTYLAGMGTVTWEGMQLVAPSNPEQFLQMRYGPNWQHPIPANNDGVVRA